VVEAGIAVVERDPPVESLIELHFRSGKAEPSGAGGPGLLFSFFLTASIDEKVALLKLTGED
jgi:hypothetical protein